MYDLIFVVFTNIFIAFIYIMQRVDPKYAIWLKKKMQMQKSDRVSVKGEKIIQISLKTLREWFFLSFVSLPLPYKQSPASMFV